MSDGASVNRGDKNSVKTSLREHSPWLVFIWCIAHRLKLAIENGLQGTIFDTIDEMILRLFYLYQKAPKKLHQLHELHEMFKGAMDFLSDSYKPKKASGTRWISHKLGAIKTCLDKWGIYIQHLESIAEDKSYKLKDREKMKGYLRKWKKTEIPFMLALFIDMLEIPSILSRSFQADIIDPVYAFCCLSKAKERFDLFDSKEFDKLPHVKDLPYQITVNKNDEHVYQNIVLSNYEAAKQHISEKKASLSEKVRTCITVHLEEESDSKGIFQYVPQLRNTEGWLRTNEEGEMDLEFGDEGLTYLYKHFSIPLMNAGVKASVPDLLNQWHDLLQYAGVNIYVLHQLPIEFAGIETSTLLGVPHGVMFLFL